MKIRYSTATFKDTASNNFFDTIYIVEPFPLAENISITLDYKFRESFGLHENSRLMTKMTPIRRKSMSIIHEIFKTVTIDDYEKRLQIGAVNSEYK